MRILTVSDSHGYAERLGDVIDRYINDIDMIIHLGDGCDDIWDLGLDCSKTDIITVRGNNDYFSNAPSVVKKEINKILIIAEHCPWYTEVEDEKDNYDKILYMHGHKHIVKLEEEDNVITLSPGALSRPRDNNPYAYAIVEIDENEDIKIEILDLNENSLVYEEY